METHETEKFAYNAKILQYSVMPFPPILLAILAFNEFY